ncbi:MAG TPA: hypothetical protein VFZ58_03270 [Candidatus Saccharimonadales bacterium]
MSQLPPEFHASRIEAYDAMLGGNSFEALARVDNQWQRERGDFLDHLEPARLNLALGTLSVDAAHFHLLSAIQSEENPQPELAAAMRASERGIAYSKELPDILRAAEAISLKGLVHVARGLVAPDGANLVPEFTEANKLALEAAEDLRSIGIHETLPAIGVISDIEARLNDWRGRRVNNGYFKQKVIELLHISRKNIPTELPSDNQPGTPELAV